jgi:hypothetical protein
MKRLLMAMTLTAVLSSSAFGGDMHGTDSPAPAPGGGPQGIQSSSPNPWPSMPMISDSFADSLLDSSLSAFLTVFGLAV